MTERARSYSWEDPTDLARSGTQMSGLEYLRALQVGDLPHPPICATVGFRFVGFDEGRAAMELEPGEHQYNTIRHCPRRRDRDAARLGCWQRCPHDFAPRRGVHDGRYQHELPAGRQRQHRNSACRGPAHPSGASRRPRRGRSHRCRRQPLRACHIELLDPRTLTRRKQGPTDQRRFGVAPPVGCREEEEAALGPQLTMDRIVKACVLDDAALIVTDS
jgi:hypothetical protein